MRSTLLIAFRNTKKSFLLLISFFFLYSQTIVKKSISFIKIYVNKLITKKIYPHLFRHQLLTYLTTKGIIDSKLQLISGHADKNSLAIYQNLSLADVQEEYNEAMRDFPVR